MRWTPDPRARGALLAACFALAFFGPELFSQSTVRTLFMTVVMGLVALGLNLMMGYAGQLALGHVFFYGAAAYLAGILAVDGTTNLFALLLAGVAVALLAALLTGIPALRMSRWALVITSFFLVELMPSLVDLWPEKTGGLAGLVGIPRLSLGGALDTADLYRVAVVLLFLWLLFQRALVYSAYGRIFAVLRQDEVQLQSLGVSPYRLKLTAYLISAVPAALAGVLVATLDGLVTYEAFGFDTVILVLAAVILGGQRTLYGPLLGALILVYAQQETLSLQNYTMLGYGAFLVLAAILLPRGVIGTIAERLPRWRTPYLIAAARADRDAVALGPEQPAGLTVERASKRFGGNQALAEVALAARPGEITALIGPNGSGKTTMLNAISGFVRLDTGDVRLGSHQLAGSSAAKVARCGVGRTFQTPSVPGGLTVREAVSVSAFADRGTGLVSTILRLPKWRAEERTIAARAAEVLDELGLGDVAHEPAVDLPLGRKRLLEIARAVLTRPALLLLDEPASGLSPDETERLGLLLRRLAAEGTTVLLVEHNMDLVLGNADTVFVLASGRMIASGPPETVSRDPQVLAVYLGESVPDDQVVA
ncbi:branched-chain amino acid ABC transporter ATP-binding protein/permease [Conexibacter sp. JD483]|uniref:branched-chain amino acid ABC transporter ATP-binding protein/permease n=1 Tax=unclassified Conexibacter TaxID=2627773 RepID=UPI0027247C20|nr:MULTISPECIES: branched-chain amino acid ABC transporter ATP-binding protein/permease [unclassified Conexibacter]MDO8189421.1 branched-chain amino acid ABC transporter ATP-binding protein/permease [Conexibacter sp. CPCC 205706]MDO8200767.1 branched-chain amino acid ABC transporter ATP-binding protein/permease [Conexibacter sp. CPCC 205762]MDR9372530.1 branched-chain amino acid ABC transporter ATP-binding protein/permease [Conexibacter sp. JD483]